VISSLEDLFPDSQDHANVKRKKIFEMTQKSMIVLIWTVALMTRKLRAAEKRINIIYILALHRAVVA
jgi:hypothetical protein